MNAVRMAFDDYDKSVQKAQERQQLRISEYARLVSEIEDLIEDSNSKVALNVKDAITKFSSL